MATSLLAYPETLAALGRRLRDGTLTERQMAAATNEFRADWATWSRVPLDKRLFPEVARLLRMYPLTGADAVHLASALLIQRRVAEAQATGAGSIAFACNDEPLRRAAEADGLSLAW